MTTDNIPDLLQVPPYRREEIRRRVAVVEHYLANQSGPAAIAAAKELGMGQTSFYMLVRAWKERHSAIDLPGAGGPRAEHHGLNDAQVGAISAAVAEMPGAIIERIAERAVEIARERAVQMPGWAAVTKHVGILTIGRIPDSSPAAAADLIIEHGVVDLPVGDPEGTTATMPIATIVTARKEACVLGIALAFDAPTAAGAARALSDALARCDPAADTRDVTIYLNSLVSDDWRDLRTALNRPGIILVEHVGAAVSPPNSTIRLVGRKLAGIRLMPRIGRRPAIARPAAIERDGRPMNLAEAEEMLRARWTPDAGERVRLPISRDALGQMAEALARAAD